MSQCWSDLTGGLVYDGEPVVTPVVKGLFGPMALSSPNEPLTEVQMVTDDVCPSWETIMESLMDELGVESLDAGVDEDQEALVKTVRERFGEPAATLLDDLLTKGLASGVDADAQDAFSLALLMNDGHNLKSIWTQGAWGGDRIQAGCFGGWAQFESEKVSLCLNTERLCDIGRAIDKACAGEAGPDLVKEAAQSLEVLCGGCIRDEEDRSKFRRALAEWLLDKAAHEQADQTEGA